MADEIVIKPTGEWLFKGEDSRLRREREDKQVQGRLGQFMDRVYCLSCGKDGGFAFRTTPYIVYQCQECADKYGNLPLPKMPDEEEMQVRNGRKD